MAPKSWLKAIPKLNGKLRAVTPLPPEPKHEGEKQNMGFKLTFGNDKMADACLLVGLISVGIILCMAIGGARGLWNDFQAQQFYADQKMTKKGQILSQLTQCHNNGMFWAETGLEMLLENDKLISQVKR